jgi:hypothetical protein
LPYIEYHLVEHCNLNCNRCGHFSPLAPRTDSDPAAFERDLRQLATHFSTIAEIRLMGGEPLLHPTPEAFVDAARRVFPDTDLRIVTNGTLLKAMKKGFWDACRHARVTLDFSVYAIMEASVSELARLCAARGVRLEPTRKKKFVAFLNPNGDSDPQRSFAYCRSYFYCPFLANSRLYVCSLPATVQYFNAAFNRAIPNDPGIDIFDPALDGHLILEKLETPVETCRSCACRYSAHPWERIQTDRAGDYEACDAPRSVPSMATVLRYIRRR